MPKYLVEAEYTVSGLEGVRAKGAQARVDALRSLCESLGGSLESFHFAFGDTDVYVIADLPDDETAAAVGITVGSSGAASTRTTKLLTAEQVDVALAKTVQYRPPGS